jgi:acyl-CoA thioester hydrolase
MLESGPAGAPEPLRSAPFSFQLRVYWEDTDAGGVVFYANYLKFFERARTEWLRSLGFGQERLRLETGTVFIVTDTAVRYLRPARLDDLLDVTVVLEHAGRAQMAIAQQAWKRSNHAAQAPELLAAGTIRIACVDAGTFKPQRIPMAVAATLSASVIPTTTTDACRRPTPG